MPTLKVVGLGPGHIDYILPKALKEIASADVVVGGRRHLESVPLEQQEKIYIGEDKRLSQVMEEVREIYPHRNTVVIVSGDTGYYSLLTYIKKIIPAGDIETIPGISSMQYLFAKLNLTWENAELTSLHGRSNDIVKMVEENKIVGCLTDKDQTPAVIAQRLTEAGLGECSIAIGENLSYENEVIIQKKVKDAVDVKVSSLSVVVIVND
jgi:cobalt-precorrin-7 (C5)-methyltransferase